MTNEDFTIEMEASFNRSRKVLSKKAKEYAGLTDRLENFKTAGAAQLIPPTQALVGFAMKHVVAIADMAKHPYDFSDNQWLERTGDIKNYMILLEALLTDLKIN